MKLTVLSILSACMILLLSTLLLIARRQPSTAMWLVFQSNRDGNNELYRLVDGDIERLTHTTLSESQPSVSPDGRWMVYAAKRTDGLFNRNLYKMRINGTDRVQLTPNTYDDLQPAWSPNGEWILFTSLRDENLDLYKMRPDGSAVHRLTDDPLLDFDGAWSPDGEWIVFTSNRLGRAHLYRMRADGSAVQQLTTTPDNYMPQWTDKGIVFAFYHLNLPSGIYTFADGRPSLVTFEAALSPKWSPDGKILAFVRHNQLFQMVDNQTRPLVATGQVARDPQWSPILDMKWHGWAWLGVGLVLMGFKKADIRRRPFRSH